MELLKLLSKNEIVVKCFWAFIVICGAYILYSVFSAAISKVVEKSSEKKTKTYVKMLNSINKYFVIIISFMIILQIFGVNVSSMIAGVGIISIILGFAIQDALKDVIKGMDIISDEYYRVGDVIKFGEITGQVLSIGLKTTKVKDVNSFNIISIANRNIEQVEVVSNLINIDVPIAYEVDIAKAEAAIEDILRRISGLENVDSCEYRGVNDLADSSIKYQIKVYCEPSLKVQVRRDALREVLLGMSENKLSVPYNQLDIHQK